MTGFGRTEQEEAMTEEESREIGCGLIEKWSVSIIADCGASGLTGGEVRTLLGAFGLGLADTAERYRPRDPDAPFGEVGR